MTEEHDCPSARYPIGRFNWPEIVTPADRAKYIETIATLPSRLRTAAAGLTDEQLETPYREGGWTLRQVIHHVPDSHMNSYIRFRLALTETEPLIKPYDEAAWANLPDVANTPVETSLCLLACLHERWVNLLRGLSESDWKRTFRHPEIGLLTLENTLALYAWHGDHHLGHLTVARTRNNW